jgi:hypothetical protein
MEVNPGRSTSVRSVYCCTSATSGGAGGGDVSFSLHRVSCPHSGCCCAGYPRRLRRLSSPSGTASLLRRAEAPVDEPAEMATHQVSRVSVAVNVIPEGDAVGCSGGGVDAESTEAGPPDATPVANASTLSRPRAAGRWTKRRAGRRPSWIR